MDRETAMALATFFRGLGALCAELHVALNHAQSDTGAEPASSRRSAASTQCSNRLLSELHESYLAEEHAGIVSSSIACRRATLRFFTEVAGDRPIATYTRADAAMFRRPLPNLPKDAGRHFSGMTDLQAIEAATPGAPRISKKTVNDRLSILSSFGKWLERTEAGFAAETFRLQRFRRPRDEKHVVQGFSDADIVSIFSCPAFTGCRSEKNQQHRGAYKIRDYRFWVPMLAAYTGARLNELAQLRIEDIVIREDIACLSIADEHASQSLKSANARRLVPLHGSLLDAGFMRHIEDARQRGWQWVFEDIAPDRDGRRSWVAGKRFRILLMRLGLKDGVRGGLHRFRHSVIDRLRMAGVEKPMIAALVGHERPDRSVTDLYGSRPTPRVADLATAVNTIRYGAVNTAR